MLKALWIFVDEYCLAVIRHLLIVDVDSRLDEDWSAENHDIDIKPTDRELQLVLADDQQGQSASSDNVPDLIAVKSEPPDLGEYYDGLETSDNEPSEQGDESQDNHFMISETEIGAAVNIETSPHITAADDVDERIIGFEVTEEMDVSDGSCQSFEEDGSADLIVSSVSSLHATNFVTKKEDNTAPDSYTPMLFTSSKQHRYSNITPQVKNEPSDSTGKSQTCTQLSFEGLYFVFFCVPYNIVS